LSPEELIDCVSLRPFRRVERRREHMHRSSAYTKHDAMQSKKMRKN
jgi:hypothetical protein